MAAESTEGAPVPTAGPELAPLSFFFAAVRSLVDGVTTGVDPPVTAAPGFHFGRSLIRRMPLCRVGRASAPPDASRPPPASRAPPAVESRFTRSTPAVLLRRELLWTSTRINNAMARSTNPADKAAKSVCLGIICRCDREAIAGCVPPRGGTVVPMSSPCGGGGSGMTRWDLGGAVFSVAPPAAATISWVGVGSRTIGGAVAACGSFLGSGGSLDTLRELQPGDCPDGATHLGKSTSNEF